VGERRAGAYVALLGPADAEHQWSVDLNAEHPVTTVPVSLAVAPGGVDEIVAALTVQRRALHRRTQRRLGRPHRSPADLPVILNDYMNTLMGDPTTARLLPLVDAAATAGADYFCIDEACSAHWRALHPAPDPAAWRSIVDPSDRLRLGLRELYAWYRETEPMTANVLRDAELLPALRPIVAGGLLRYLDDVGRILTEPIHVRGRLRERVEAAESPWAARLSRSPAPA